VSGVITHNTLRSRRARESFVASKDEIAAIMLANFPALPCGIDHVRPWALKTALLTISATGGAPTPMKALSLYAGMCYNVFRNACAALRDEGVLEARRVKCRGATSYLAYTINMDALNSFRTDESVFAINEASKFGAGRKAIQQAAKR